MKFVDLFASINRYELCHWKEHEFPTGVFSFSRFYASLTRTSVALIDKHKVGQFC